MGDGQSVSPCWVRGGARTVSAGSGWVETGTVPGGVGARTIAPPPGRRKAIPRYSQGVSWPWCQGSRPWGAAGRLTPFSGPTYDPPHDERATPRWGDGAFACLSGSRMTEPRGSMERISRRHDEADLPAQEAPPRQGARLPRPDEDDGRTPGPGRAPGSRSQAPVGLIAERGPRPPRLVMLSSPRDFAALTERGTMRSHPLLATRVLRTDLGTTRFGLATSRALGSAVVRNRVRRRLREAIRAMASQLRPGWDVLIVARPALVTADHRAMVGTLTRLLQRSGVLGGDGRDVHRDGAA